MTTRRRLGPAAAFAAAIALALSAGPAAAFVNPNFTPLDVFRQYTLICAVTADPIAADAQAVTFTVAAVLKGQTRAKKLTLDLTGALAAKDGPAEVKWLLSLLSDAGNRPGVLFVPGPEAQVPSVLLHFEGAWFRAAPGEGPTAFRFEKIDTSLNGTFNGGSDMLIETMRFIARFPDSPIMPVDAGVKWDIHDHVGTLPGKAAGLRAVDVNGDGKLDVFAACPAGDRVFVAKGRKFEPLAGLVSASLAADWADFDGDGRPDLASLSAGGLKLCLQAEPGKFKAVNVELPGRPAAGSPTVHAVDFDADGRPDLIVVGAGLPIVLRNLGEAKLETLKLGTVLDNADRFGGEVGPVAVADFDGDGWLDIVQCRQSDGLFFRGRPGGKFDAGVACGAAMGEVKGRQACLGDFDGDGRPELLLVGGGRRPALSVFHAGPPSRFESVTRYMGEPSYIIQVGAACAAPGDANNDTFVDLFVGYADEPSQCFFNRGFRSLAICEPLKLPAEEIGGADKGQSAVLWADMDSDGSLDLLTAISPPFRQEAEAGGSVYLSMTSLGAMKSPIGIAVRLGPKAGAAGPLAVTFHTEGYCLGARTIEGRFGQPALMGLPAPGEYTVKWRLPGKPEQSRKVTVIDALVTMTIGQ